VDSLKGFLIRDVGRDRQLILRGFRTLVGSRFLAGLLLFLLFATIRSNGQDLRNLQFDILSSENIKIEKGLSQNTVHSIFQDESGYMWFGTWDGLNKYDGYTFTTFNQQNGLSGQTIHAIFQDSEGFIWIGTDDGLNRINSSTNEISVFKHIESDTFSLVNNVVTAIIEDKLTNLWIGTHQGLSMFDRKTGKFHPYLHLGHDNNLLRSNYINDLCHDERGFLWIGTNIGLIRFDLNTLSLKRFFHKPGDTTSLPNNQVRSVYKDMQGILWIGTVNGLGRFNQVSQDFTIFYSQTQNDNSLTDNSISVIFEDTKGYLWIGTDNGLNIYDRVKEIFYRLKHESYNLNSISNNRIMSIYEDASGSIWIGTFIGVSRYDRYSSKFRHFRHMPDDTNCLNSNYVISIFEDHHRTVWIATDNGMNLMDRSTGKFSYMIHVPDDPNSLVSNDLRVAIQDKRGNYWIGTSNEGLDRYDPESKIFTHFQYNPKNKNSLRSNDILSLFEDSDGLIWIGTGTGGLNRFDPDNEHFKAYMYSNNDQFSISSNNIWAIYEDSMGDIWLGTDNGLNCFKKKENKFYRYIYDPVDPESLSAKDVFSIYEDQSGTLWIGTKGGGLNKFDHESGKFKAFTEDDGLANNVVYATLEDEKGNLWISTNWGLSKFNIQEETFINYDVKDGIQSNEFNLGADFQNIDGEMYFGGMNGFNLFHPSEIKINPRKPTTVITSFQIFNKKVDYNINNGDTIHLSARDNFFTIEFSALDYTNPSKNRYQYILENYDKLWIHTDADKRYSEYTNVRPGTYTYYVKGSNNDGIWDENGVSLTIIIRPFWYNTWLFRIGFLVILIIGIWYLIYRRIRNIRRHHEVEKKMLAIQSQLHDTELQALRLQMNPHFIFNTLNSIQSFILTNDTDKAVNYLGKFSQLMRQILANSRESYITIKEEVKALQYYMDIEKLRFDDKFDYSFIMDPDIDEDFMEMPPMVIQPYVENAIIHGLIHKKGKGKIEIKVSMAGNNILWTIEDNGVGRKKAMKIREESGLHRKSRGMLITMERLEVLNKKNGENFSVKVIDLKDNNGEAAGTRVELRISYKEG